MYVHVLHHTLLILILLSVLIVLPSPPSVVTNGPGPVSPPVLLFRIRRS